MQKCSALEEVDHLVSGTDHKARTFNCWPTFISIHLNVQETVILQTKWPIKKSPFKMFFFICELEPAKAKSFRSWKILLFCLDSKFSEGLSHKLFPLWCYLLQPTKKWKKKKWNHVRGRKDIHWPILSNAHE